MKMVLIIDDHPIFSAGLKGVIEGGGKYRVVAEARDGEEGFRMAKRFRPDIAMVDMRLGDTDGVSLTRRILNISENTRVMIVSAHSDIDYVRGAVRAGALGYMVKGSGDRGILKCLDAVAGGKQFIDRALSEKMCDLLTSGKKSDDRYGELTPREQEIMKLVIDGLDLEEIRKKLNISYGTVTVHRSNFMKKLGFEKDTELIRYAMRVGLIDPDVWKYG